MAADQVEQAVREADLEWLRRMAQPVPGAKAGSPADVQSQRCARLLSALSEVTRERDEMRETALRNQRIVELVTAPGSRVESSKLVPGMVVVVDGRTGLDACEPTADAAFDTLFEEADGGESPGRITLSVRIAGEQSRG